MPSPDRPKVPVALPAGIEILGGTAETLGLLLLRPTTTPAAGAALLRVIVPVAPPSRTISDGVTRRSVSTGGGSTTASGAVRITEPSVAVSVTCPTAFPGTIKATMALPAGIVTLAGTGATAGLLLLRLTTIPPAGAIPLRVTVNVDVPPKEIWNWLGVSAVSVGGGGTTVSGAVRLAPARVAMMVVCPGALPEMGTVALVLPAGIVMFAGTEAIAGLLLVRLITAPPTGAMPFRVTVAVAAPPTII